MITTAPFDPRGYAVGETIGVQITFSEEVAVSGSPRLALEIGENTRHALWDEEASVGASVAFRYGVTLEDRDDDGISIGADALFLDDGEIRNRNGVEADLNIGPSAIPDDGGHLVLGAPPARACGDERSLALEFALAHPTPRGRAPVVVAEWDGTPFRVDIVRNFPDFVTDADLQQLLDPIGRLADQIEAQLGYRILEAGDFIEVPKGAPEGWDQDFDSYYWNCSLPREPGQILALYLNDDNDWWGSLGASPLSAHVGCGSVSYNKRSLGPMWTGEDPCCQGDANQYPREGEVIVHEVFHVLGFIHADDDLPFGVRMSLGGLHAPETGSLTYYAEWTDVDKLRCIFPEGG